MSGHCVRKSLRPARVLSLTRLVGITVNICRLSQHDCGIEMAQRRLKVVRDLASIASVSTGVAGFVSEARNPAWSKGCAVSTAFTSASPPNDASSAATIRRTPDEDRIAEQRHCPSERKVPAAQKPGSAKSASARVNSLFTDSSNAGSGIAGCFASGLRSD